MEQKYHNNKEVVEGNRSYHYIRKVLEFIDHPSYLVEF